MKTLTFVLTFAFALAFTTLSFAGNKPALTYPAGQLAVTAGTVDVTPWHKGEPAYQGGIVVAKTGNGICPVMNHRITSKHHAMIVLSNGKGMEVCCPSCKQDVEKDLSKYETYMF